MASIVDVSVAVNVLKELIVYRSSYKMVTLEILLVVVLNDDDDAVVCNKDLLNIVVVVLLIEVENVL